MASRSRRNPLGLTQYGWGRTAMSTPAGVRMGDSPVAGAGVERAGQLGEQLDAVMVVLTG